MLSLALAAATALSMTACGGSKPAADNKPAENKEAAAEDWKWERNIEIICPWGTGGGADTTLRQFATALEKEIGVKVVVNNKAGAGGVTGVQFASQQPADGYTYLLCTPSPMLAQISGATDFDVYGTIQPLCQLVHDCNIFVTGKNSPYNNYDELKAYIEANPGKVKCGVMTINGLDAACVQAGFNGGVEAVAYTEGSQLNADVIGGHVDLACCGPAEVAAMVASGDMKVIMSCTEKPMTLEGYDGVQCAGDVGLDCFFGPARGIFYIEGTPEAALKAFEAAAEKAVASEEYQKWAKGEGLDQRQGWKNMADFKASWDADYKDLDALFGSGAAK